MTTLRHPLVVSHDDPASFTPAWFTPGLRRFFACRDLALRHVTAGRAGAHVIRAVPGSGAKPASHTPDLAFQLVQGRFETAPAETPHEEGQA
jgi:hypothetical protein